MVNFDNYASLPKGTYIKSSKSNAFLEVFSIETHGDLWIHPMQQLPALAVEQQQGIFNILPRRLGPIEVSHDQGPLLGGMFQPL